MPSAAAEPDMVHLVTGGGGYPGFNLGRKLAQSGKQVILVDIIQPRWPLEENMKFIQVIEFGFINCTCLLLSSMEKCNYPSCVN